MFFFIDTDCLETCTVSINQFLFDGQIPSIDTVYIKTNHGLILNKVWISHNNLRNIHLVLQTIDDLYIYITRWADTKCRNDDYSVVSIKNTLYVKDVKNK